MFTDNSIKFKEVKQGDDDFLMSDGIRLVPRAYIELSDVCPTNLKLAIQRAMADGYLKCVANVRDRDYMWEKLGG